MATVVSTSDKLPPPAAASTAEAAAFSSGNSPMTRKIMVAEGQVPPDELAAYALEEFSNGLLAIFWLSQHALDGV